MMELLGLVEIEHGAAVHGKGWCALGVEPTPFGASLLRPLVKEKGDLLFSEAALDDSGEAAQGGALRPLFGPLFSAWRRSLDAPTRPFQDGSF